MLEKADFYNITFYQRGKVAEHFIEIKTGQKS